jgi:hypothetical protein
MKIILPAVPALAAPLIFCGCVRGGPDRCEPARGDHA